MPLVVPYVKLPQLRTFPRPTGLRQTHNTQQTATSERYVDSEDKLRAAIGEIATLGLRTFGVGSDPDAPIPRFGVKIVLTGTISISSTITIPPECSGLTLLGGGGMVVPGAVGITAFNVQARFVTFDAFSCVSPDPTNYFGLFVNTEDAGAGYDAPYIISLRRCLLGSTDRLFVETDGNGGHIIDGCLQAKFSGATSAPVVFIGSRSVMINTTLSDGGGDSVTVSGAASGCRIIGNDCGGGDVTTSASAGGNVIVGNVRVGTITRHITDAEGLNT